MLEEEARNEPKVMSDPSAAEAAVITSLYVSVTQKVTD